MAADPERYAEYYADQLWSMVPGYHRDLDISSDGSPGPLRALIDRLGVQVAVVRRSLDRLWEDQSIESSDDWLIPYIGELVATRLVSGLDSRGQRLDVYRTVHYRRRKGTIPVLEEIVSDLTGWNARVVEFFRRLGRTRHGFDPGIGVSPASPDPITNPDLRYDEGLVGRITNTGTGGFADLRSVYGASRAGGAYDEYAHTFDVRRGRGRTGWYQIPRLGVFLWRLYSFQVLRATPVSCAAGLFSFDPTGRLTALFSRAYRGPASYGDEWVSPDAWQLPGPIDPLLLADQLGNLYPSSIDVLQVGAGIDSGLPADQVVIHPTLGTFRINPAIGGVVASYCYGFPSRIGAGPYDRRVVGPSAPAGSGPSVRVVGGGVAFSTAVAANPSGTVEIADSLTYDGPGSVPASGPLRLRAANRQRPLVRAFGSPWVISGAGDTLSLDGLFFSGRDLVLRGPFKVVRLTCCTFDPGNSSAVAGTRFDQSVDGHDLSPARIWIENREVEQLEIDRCVLAAVRTRNGGTVGRLSITDSIVQAIPTTLMMALAATEIVDPGRLAARLREFGQAGIVGDPLAAWLYSKLSPQTQNDLNAFGGAIDPPAALIAELVTDLETLIESASIYDPARFANVNLSPDALAAATGPPPADPKRLNRLLLAEAFPMELDDLALGLGAGSCELVRCTIDGRSYVHSLQASECIFTDRTLVEDTQHGCIRFSAYANDSVVPRQFESVSITPRYDIFTSRAFGRAGYLQLVEDADLAITHGLVTITAGGPNGSEMGCYAQELYPIKQRAIRLKFDEYMPLGLEPVIVNVT